MSYMPTKKTKERLEDLEDVTDGDGTDIWFTSATMKGHIIPSVNASGWQNGSPGFDIGSAEYKVRHLFLSDNSLWIGDQHKVSAADGQIRFRKLRDRSPKMVLDVVGSYVGTYLIHAMQEGDAPLVPSTVSINETSYTFAAWTDTHRDAMIQQAVTALGFDGDGHHITPNEWRQVLVWLGDSGLNAAPLTSGKWNPDDGIFTFDSLNGGTVHFSEGIPNEVLYDEMADFDPANNRIEHGVFIEVTSETANQWITVPLVSWPIADGYAKIRMHLKGKMADPGDPPLFPDAESGMSTVEAVVSMYGPDDAMDHDGFIQSMTVFHNGVCSWPASGGSQDGIFGQWAVSDMDGEVVLAFKTQDLPEGLEVTGRVWIDVTYVDGSSI